MIVDRLDRAALYLGLSPRIAVALRALQAGELARKAPGRYELEGDKVFALVQEYKSRPRSQAKLEAHRKYIDVQYVVEGAEAIGYAPVDGLRELDPYSAEKDVAFFAGFGDPVTFRKGMFAILFPHDGHAPGLGLTGEGGDQVRKIVVKVAIHE